VPAEIIVGNTLSWDIREVWYTPAHHLGLWKYRLRRNEETLEVDISTTEQPAPPRTVTTKSARAETPAIKPAQLGFDF